MDKSTRQETLMNLLRTNQITDVLADFQYAVKEVYGEPSALVINTKFEDLIVHFRKAQTSSNWPQITAERGT